jgi:hypothetical protein
MYENKETNCSMIFKEFHVVLESAKFQLKTEDHTHFMIAICRNLENLRNYKQEMKRD